VPDASAWRDLSGLHDDREEYRFTDHERPALPDPAKYVNPAPILPPISIFRFSATGLFRPFLREVSRKIDERPRIAGFPRSALRKTGLFIAVPGEIKNGYGLLAIP
jgi:hypothetical protein